MCRTCVQIWIMYVQKELPQTRDVGSDRLRLDDLRFDALVCCFHISNSAHGLIEFDHLTAVRCLID
jgi:hypothetical protein